MPRALTNLLLKNLQRACSCIDDSLKVDISKRIDDFYKSQFANDLYYLSFVLMLSKALGKSVEYSEKIDIDSLDFIHKCALARIYFLQGKRDENLLNEISEAKLDSVYDMFLKLGVMSDYGLAAKMDSWLNKLKFFSKFAGGFSNIANSTFASTNASGAALCVSYLLGKKVPEKNIEFLLNNQDASGGYFAEESSQCPDLLSTSTAIFSLSLYGKKPKINPLEFIEAHCLEDGTFSATIKDEKGDLEYTFYGLLAIGALC